MTRARCAPPAAGPAAPVPIALVEDNALLRAELLFLFAHAGYAPTGLVNGAALDAHLACQPCRLVVLDLGLPGEDGLSVCERLRRTRPELGIVVVSGRGTLQHRLDGLRGGADAYLVKPAPVEELLLVIANLLRRLDAAPHAARGTASGTVPGTAPPAGAPVWRLDAHRLVAITPAGCALVLTRVECLLLQVLARCAPCAATRRQLVEAQGGNYLEFDEHRIEVAVSRLRGKLAQAWPHAPAIRTVRGVGYLLVQPWLPVAGA
ncbi:MULTISPECIES: response regulator transcription factor [Cupriavidus]